MMQKVIKFMFVGGINTVLDFLLFNFFAHVLELSIFGLQSVILAQILSASVVVPISYILNRHFTFSSDKSHKETFVHYILISFFNAWILQTTVIGLVVYTSHTVGILTQNAFVLDNIAKCCGIALGMISNFFFYHRIFEHKSSKN
ncbi:MAG: GtrA family protein [Candidatus Ancillula sp.]|jgi:putative flippase GtrA|nr:GtrA family protein [Candidatus Ancillula sp.]